MMVPSPSTRFAGVLAALALLLAALSVFLAHPSVAHIRAHLFVQHLQMPPALRPVIAIRAPALSKRGAADFTALPDSLALEGAEGAAARASLMGAAQSSPVTSLAKWTVAALSLCATVLAVFRISQTWSSEVLLDLECPLMMAAATGIAGRRVAVTGAAGRTGRLVVQRLLELRYTPVCVVKGDKSAQAVQKLGVPKDNVKLVSVTDSVAALTKAFAGCDAVILCTSAVPKIQLLSIVKIFLRKCFGREAGRPTFTFPEGGSPEEVDWIGTKNQVDAAKAAGVTHFVMVSSMGGTQPDNFLNTIGKKPDGTGGDILLWKRKGEEYLAQSGLKYTIVHPGGLLDQPGGKRQLVFGVDDQLLAEKVRSIPRADVAEVCVQALSLPGAINRSIDVISRPEGEGQPTTDFEAFFANPGNCKY